MVNLVVCCDGTWNTPDDTDGGLPAPTNVVKFYNSLADNDSQGSRQVKYYHPGVGTDGSWFDRVAGGGLGRGLNDNIKSAYRWVADHYRPGDRIWLFGFSRGAYTVRSLGGMISMCGLLDAANAGRSETDIWAAVEAVMQAYRKKRSLKATTKRPFHNVSLEQSTAKTTPIHFIGVWDTVGALGLPDDLFFLKFLEDPEDYSFHDTELSSIIAHARHAMAIDEMRQSFEPTIWSNNPAEADIVQVWFPGVHSDVGGGYAQSGLSDGALDWMVRQAEQQGQGLAFREAMIAQITPNPQGLLHDSVDGIFKALKTCPRSVPSVDQRNAGIIHTSAFDRQASPPLTQPSYWPTCRLAQGEKREFRVYASQRWNATGIYLEEATEYTLTAAGQWLDRTLKCGPKGMKDGHFEPGEVIHLASNALGGLEKLYNATLGSGHDDFWWTRREENAAWFALVGVIANDWRDINNSLSHEVITIGDGCKITPRRSGYLYAFANDAWHAYGNNKGSVILTVER